MFFNNKGWQKIKQEENETIIELEEPEERIKSAGILTKKDQLIIYGGLSLGSIYEDLWVMDLRQGKWEKKEAKGEKPEYLFGHSCTQYGNKMILFGGMNRDCSNQIFELDLENFEWKKLENCPYEGRHSHTACLEEETSEIWFFGGYLGGAKRTNEMISYNIKRNQWEKYKMYGDIPSVRSSCSAIIWKDLIVVFGGFEQANGYYNNLYFFETKTLTWTEIIKPNAPSPRDRCSCWIDYSQNKMMVFGGMVDDKHFCDLHSFDLDFLIWDDLTPNNQIKELSRNDLKKSEYQNFVKNREYKWPPPSGGHVVCSSLETHYIVLFSGSKQTINRKYINSIYVFQSLPDITQDLLKFSQETILRDI
ncbi:tip elongation aberrant protein [Anaeramoeba ignava]|uniref:Tip elongation aberrant protein n=1 Tax=Anaeramoeba ignava TaxID=1746090 RepID=A0A9Q0LHS2_ANAIG|nr:tip elongation aberrant protein [Anaeramoeba ignava]